MKKLIEMSYFVYFSNTLRTCQTLLLLFIFFAKCKFSSNLNYIGQYVRGLLLDVDISVKGESIS